MATGLGIGITDDLNSGEVLEIPSLVLNAVQNGNVYELNKPLNIPASGNDSTNAQQPGGIDYMQIGRNFIVS
jgi:hypothetical protein